MGQFQIDIGERIAKKRKEKKLSQSELAFELDKSLRTIQKYESGDIDMPISVLKSISEILEVPMNYLLGYDSSHIKIESLADVFAFLIELDKKQELGFTIRVDKAVNINERYGYIIFNGNNFDLYYNDCLVKNLKEYNVSRGNVASYWWGQKQFDYWKDGLLEKLSDHFLTDKEVEDLDNEARKNKFLELQRQKFEGKKGDGE